MDILARINFLWGILFLGGFFWTIILILIVGDAISPHNPRNGKARTLTNRGVLAFAAGIGLGIIVTCIGLGGVIVSAIQITFGIT